MHAYTASDEARWGRPQSHRRAGAAARAGERPPPPWSRSRSRSPRSAAAAHVRPRTCGRPGRSPRSRAHRVERRAARCLRIRRSRSRPRPRPGRPLLRAARAARRGVCRASACAGTTRADVGSAPASVAPRIRRSGSCRSRAERGLRGPGQAALSAGTRGMREPRRARCRAAMRRGRTRGRRRRARTSRRCGARPSRLAASA